MKYATFNSFKYSKYVIINPESIEKTNYCMKKHIRFEMIYNQLVCEFQFRSRKSGLQKV